MYFFLPPFQTSRYLKDQPPIFVANMQQLWWWWNKAATNLSCDWLTRFMKVILLGLSLVRTSLQFLQYMCTESGLQYKHTAVQLIQAKCVSTSVCGQLYRTLQLCTRVQFIYTILYSSKVYQ